MSPLGQHWLNPCTHIIPLPVSFASRHVQSKSLHLVQHLRAAFYEKKYFFSYLMSLLSLFWYVNQWRKSNYHLKTFFFLFGRGVTAPRPWELVPTAKIEQIPKMFSLGLRTSAPDFSLSVRGRKYWEVEFYCGQQCFTNLGQCEAALTAELCLKAGETPQGSRPNSW